MKKTFLKKKPASGEVVLQITSMADIFMILLVFLLKSYAVSMTNISPASGISLPEVSKAKGVVKDTMKIEIAKDQIMVDERPAVKLKNFEFSSAEMGADGLSPTIVRLVTEQRTMKPLPNPDPGMLVMADQNTPYPTIKRVIASAAKAGFVDLQLIVVENQ